MIGHTIDDAGARSKGVKALMLGRKHVWLLFCLMPFPVPAQAETSTLIEEILDRAVQPIQMDFIPQGDQLFALTYAQRTFTVLRRETNETSAIEGHRPIAMYDLLETETQTNPGSFALAQAASLAPLIAQSEFERFGAAAERCLTGVDCTVRNLSFDDGAWTSDDIFRLVTDAVSQDASVYESLTFSGTSNLDGSQYTRTAFLMQTADIVIGLVEPRDRVERSYGDADSIVYDLLIFAER